MVIRRLRSRRGMSNITEYAVLIAVVAGAAIAMQPYLKGRLQGASKGAADNYDAAVGAAGIGAGSHEPVRNSTSDAITSMVMGNATTGNVTVDSRSTVGQNK